MSAEVKQSEPTERGSAHLVVGLGYGDEGKGKIVHFIGRYADVGMRSQGGKNAGHTIYLRQGELSIPIQGEGLEINTHQIPTTVAYEHTRNLIGPDAWLDPEALVQEMADLKAKGIEITPENLGVSNLASLVLPSHIFEDAAKEENGNGLGSTKAGMAFVARDEALHEDIRASAILVDNAREILWQAAYEGLADCVNWSAFENDVDATNVKRELVAAADKFVAAALAIKPYITETVKEIQDHVDAGKQIVIEGAQGAGLDRRYGKHPHVTSSTTLSAGLIKGAGLSHKDVGLTIGVIKAFPSKVGGGEFPDEITDEEILAVLKGEEGAVDEEKGKTSGRDRQIGWLSIPLLRHYIRMNGVDELALTKLDKVAELAKVTTKFSVVIKYVKNAEGGSQAEMSRIPDNLADLHGYEPVTQEFDVWHEDITGARSFEELPENARGFLKFLEQELGLPIGMVGVGPASDEIIVRPELLERLKESRLQGVPESSA